MGSCKLRSVRVHSRGLTLAELLVFLALAALLSALGMYGLARYLRHSRTAEAVGSLNTLGANAATAYDASDATQPTGTEPQAAKAMRHFPPSSRSPVPPDLTDVRGKQYRSAPADWDVAPWRELRFSIPQPQFYAYSFKSEGVGSTATARIETKLGPADFRLVVVRASKDRLVRMAFFSPGSLTQNLSLEYRRTTFSLRDLAPGFDVQWRTFAAGTNAPGALAFESDDIDQCIGQDHRQPLRGSLSLLVWLGTSHAGRTDAGVLV